MTHNTTPLNDNSLMPLGNFKGMKMTDVPAWYLNWYRDNAKNPNPALIEYISDNKHHLCDPSSNKFSNYAKPH